MFRKGKPYKRPLHSEGCTVKSIIYFSDRRRFRFSPFLIIMLSRKRNVLDYFNLSLYKVTKTRTTQLLNGKFVSHVCRFKPIMEFNKLQY